MTALSHFARRFYRAYRNGRIRLGHSLLKRIFSLGLGREQQVCLRSGLRLRLDLSKPNQAGIFWYDGDADVALSWAIRELLPIGGTFVDCGANTGLMGLLAAQYRLARVLFIEPHPRLAETIRANIALNQFENRAEVMEAAASDSPGFVTFYENPAGDDGTHSLHADWVEKGSRALGKVRCEPLQDLIRARGFPRVDFLKVDTEGSDLAVLRGLGELLRPSFASTIYVEMTREAESIRELMTARGYVGFGPVPRRGRELVRLQHLYERGGRPHFFDPLGTGASSSANGLWCGQDSAIAGYLTDLAQD